MLEGLYRSLPREYDGSLIGDDTAYESYRLREQLLKVAFTADSGEVETIAHLRAARELNPKVDFVLDIGGKISNACYRVVSSMM